LWERRYAARLAVLLASAAVAAHSTAPTQHRSHEALRPQLCQSRRFPSVPAAAHQDWRCGLRGAEGALCREVVEVVGAPLRGATCGANGRCGRRGA
jgi:hypothetical protein